MRNTFHTPGPVSLYVEIGAGSVTVHATETADTEVLVEGRDADDVTVDCRDREVVVIGPQRRAGFFGTSSELTVTVTLPSDSDLATRLGSADLVATGRYAAARVKTGSGDVRISELTDEAVVETGSGSIEIGSAHSSLRAKAGSGDIALGRVAGAAVVSAGSGSVEISSAEDTTALKSGSGDIAVKEAHTDLSAATGSGDVYVGRIRRGVVKAKAGSGDIHVGVPAGIPVWTDVSCVSGSVRSNLTGAGQPEDGQDYIEIRATTVSGDINLAQL
jgi:hypothetical protein